MTFGRDALNRLYHYSIRKTSLGVGSVVIGIFLTGLSPLVQQVAADDVVPSSSLVTSLDKRETEEVTATTAEPSADLDSSKDQPAKTLVVPTTAVASSAQVEQTETKQPEEKENLSEPTSLIANTDKAVQSGEKTTENTTDENSALNASLENVQKSIRADRPSELVMTPTSNSTDKENTSRQETVSSVPEWQDLNYYNDKDKSYQFDANWKFMLGDATGAGAEYYDDSSWKHLDLPHDFSLNQDYTANAEAESGYKEGGIGWYRKSFVPGLEAMKGRISLQFDGSYMETEVFINGHSLGVHPNGYSPFSFDLTDYLKANQENTLAVKVVNRTPSSRWYSGSGIYRSVYLNVKPAVHLTEYGVKVTTPDVENTYQADTGSHIIINANIANQSASRQNIRIKNILFERTSEGTLGQKVAESVLTDEKQLAEGETYLFENQLTLKHPKLWSVDQPNLYILRTEVYQDGDLIETNDLETGFRFTHFDKNRGFSLNGQAMKLQGVSMHHDQGALGSSAYYDAIERQVAILKTMGVNAIRVTHNPAAKALIDIANRKGMLIVEEAFDGWQDSKNSNTYDYARFFNQAIGASVTGLINNRGADETWAEFNLKQMVRRDVNAPAVIMWSTGNEVMEGTNRQSANGYPELIKTLVGWIDEIDGNRPSTVGDNYLKLGNTVSVGMAESLASNAKIQGLAGYNYADGSQFDAAHQKYPDWIIYGSETASSVNSRGVYNVKGVTKRSDDQLTSYDQSKVRWGHLASKAWYDVIKRDFVAGEFVWTGFDYLGEPTPWNNTGSGAVGKWPSPKSSYFGIVDTAGLPKDTYYFYQSQWNKHLHTLHIVPGTWTESALAKDQQNRVEVSVYTDAKKVELYHISPNGERKLIGSKEFTKVTTPSGFSYQLYEGQDKQRDDHQNLYLTWWVPYEEGQLQVVGYDEHNQIIHDAQGTQLITSFGQASAVKAAIDRLPSQPVTDQDLAYVDLSILDAEGNLVTTADNRVSVEVSGPAVLVGLDNGNAVDHQSYQDKNRKAFSGKLVAILRMTGESGPVLLQATSAGLTSSTVSFDVVGAPKENNDLVAYQLSKTFYLRPNQTPQLPDHITVKNSAGQERTERLIFDDQALKAGLATGRDFTLIGRIGQTGFTADVRLAIIDHVAAMQNIATAVEINTMPSLPSKVQAYLEDGNLLSTPFPVEWTMPEKSVFTKAGTVVVKGQADVLGQKLPVTASVRISPKTITDGSNVAPMAVDLTATTTSDNLEAIRDGNLLCEPNTSGSNTTRWSNYHEAAEKGNPNATIRFAYATAQSIRTVNIVYTQDNWSLRIPDEGKESAAAHFSWQLTGSDEAQDISAQVVARKQLNGSNVMVTYQLEHAVPAVVFNVNLTSTNVDLNGHKTSLGISEIELLTAVESFVKYSDASLDEVRVGDEVYRGNQLSTSMTVRNTGEISASNHEKNVAVTILPQGEDRVNIYTSSEDQSHHKTYTLHLLSESPKTDGNSAYLPTSQVTLEAGSEENRSDNLANNANDFNWSSIWHSAWSGTAKENLWLSLDTKSEHFLNGFAYLARQDSSPNGKVRDYEIYISSNKTDWKKVAEGQFKDSKEWQEVAFPAIKGRYLKLQALHTMGDSGGDRFMSASEVRARILADDSANLPVTHQLTASHVSLVKDSYTYTGQAIEPAVRVIFNQQELQANKDYQVTYEDNIGQESGNHVARVIVTGLGAYQGSVTKIFTIMGQPALEVAADGTVELANHYDGNQSFSESAIAKALTSDDYLKKTYQVFPHPQKVTYGDGLIRLDQKVNIVIGANVDIYTRNRLKEVLQAHHISYSVSRSLSDTSPNILLGIAGQTSAASQAQAGLSIDPSLYQKIDAYSLVLKNNTISVLGKDTDAVFYGLTTLKQILKENELPILREVVVEDYADVKNRGFIEGYYGNPWSNADRAELMRFGGDLKLTEYFFAPKDDPYHNSQWRDLYPDDKLAEIRELARVGNQSKTRYVWTIHPFMHRPIRFGNEANYQEDLATIKAKFGQLMEAGVREFGILADDAATPVGGYGSYTRLMKDMTDWLTEKQATYPDLKKEMIFVPGNYRNNGSSDEVRALNKDLPESSMLTLTGGRVWGEVSANFLNTYKKNVTATGASYRPVQLWINWPCTDNSKKHLILGGADKFLHPGIDASLVGGIMLNPMQQSEPSKVALFDLADYAWKTWQSSSDAQTANDKAFNFIETGTFEDSSTSVAFRELAKHMINQNMDRRVVKLEESIDLAPKLTNFLTKWKAGQDITSQRDELRQEFASLKAAAETYKSSGDKRMREQIIYWLDNTIDQMKAIDHLLTATDAASKGNQVALWENYKAGLDLYNQSKTHTFWYVNGYQRAEFGVQHIRPFITNLLEGLSSQIESSLDPTALRVSLMTNRQLEGDVTSITDGDLKTEVLSKSPNTITVGDYIGLAFNHLIDLHSLNLALGAISNPEDTFTTAVVEYQNDHDDWVILPNYAYTGNENIMTFTGLDIKAKGVRIRATADKSNTWLGVREIAVNKDLPKSQEQSSGQLTHSENLAYKLNTSQADALDGKDNTEAMFANSNNEDKTPANAWIQLTLPQLTDVTRVYIKQGATDKIANGSIEYSSDLQTWHLLKAVDGSRTYDIETSIQAKAIRILNTEETEFWWRIAEFKVESRKGVIDFTDTNLDSLKDSQAFVTTDSYLLQLPADQKLGSQEYIGLKLDRLHELADLSLVGSSNDQLELLYSPNLIEWYHKDQVSNHKFVRYVRLVNLTDQDQVIGASGLQVKTKEINPVKLESTTFDISSAYGQNDVRHINNLADLFDGSYNKEVEWSDTPVAGDSIVIKLGSQRQISHLRAYIQDSTINYLRDGNIQLSTNGQDWVNIITVGDGVANDRHDNSLTDGWIHDSERPGNRYIEGSLDQPMATNYIRILTTADYPHRFVAFTEFVINHGEFAKKVANPTVETTSPESEKSLATNIIDGSLLTSYKTVDASGQLLYHLSEHTDHNHITLLSNAGSSRPIHVWARVLDSLPISYDQEPLSHWVDLATVTDSFARLALPSSAKALLDIKLAWTSPELEIYELKTYYDDLEVPTQPSQPEVTSRIYTDKDTGVTVLVQGESAKDKLDMSVEVLPAKALPGHFETTSGAVVEYLEKAYDISFHNGDNKVSALDALVTLPIDANQGKVVGVYYLKYGQDASEAYALAEPMEIVSLDDVSVTFKTSHFSIYAITYEGEGAADLPPTNPEDDTPVAPTLPATPPTAPSDPTSSDSPVPSESEPPVAPTLPEIPPTAPSDPTSSDSPVPSESEPPVAPTNPEDDTPEAPTLPEIPPTAPSDPTSSNSPVPSESEPPVAPTLPATPPTAPSDPTSSDSPVDTDKEDVSADSSQNLRDKAELLVDLLTGVEVTLSAGETSKIHHLVVTHLETNNDQTPKFLVGKDFDLFAIRTVDDRGNFIQLTHKALIALPLDQDKIVKDLVYLSEEGTLEPLSFAQVILEQNGKQVPALVFTTSHLSPYAVIYQEKSSETLSNSDNTSKSAQAVEQVVPVVTTVDLTDRQISFDTVSKKQARFVGGSKELPSTGDKSSQIYWLGLLLSLGAISLLGYHRKEY